MVTGLVLVLGGVEGLGDGKGYDCVLSLEPMSVTLGLFKFCRTHSQLQLIPL